MAKRQEIIVTLIDGEASIQLEGVSGPSCEALTEELERQLGVLKARARTAAYYLRETTSVQRRADRRPH